MIDYIFTSESVSDGHPDKVADQISDALVDAGLAAGDETTRVAVETLVTTNYVVLAGEVKNFNVSNEQVEQIVRDTVKRIGYEQDGFHWDKLTVDNKTINNQLHSQSAVSVDGKQFARVVRRQHKNLGANHEQTVACLVLGMMAWQDRSDG